MIARFSAWGKRCQSTKKKVLRKWVGGKNFTSSHFLILEGGIIKNIMRESWKRCRGRTRGTGEWFKRKRGGEIESLHSTFLCELTGLDAQLTGLFWQVSDGPYYHFTAGPLGPCITGHNSTGQAGKKKGVKWQESLKKEIPTLDFLSVQLTGTALSQSLGISCMFSVDQQMCVVAKMCVTDMRLYCDLFFCIL